MNLGPIQDVLNQQLLNLDNRCLNVTELLVLQGILQNRTYREIAQQEGYSSRYFANVVAPELYRRLSALTGKRVTKKNCQIILQSYLTTQTQPITNRSGLESSLQVVQNSPQTNVSGEWLEDSLPNPQLSSSPGYPCGAVPLNSPFYLKSPLLESQIINAISQPGGLVRIKAPQEMGKTSLLLRILKTCEQELGYKTVSLNLQKADQHILEDLNQFLRWLCVNCTRQLGLRSKLDNYWDDDLGSKMSWTVYFEEYLLAEIASPLVLALDEVNQVFEHPKISEDFFPLLRSCYEEAKRNPLWQKFRLIVVHSTEIYVPLRLEQSPFNIGLPVELQRFSQPQVEQLASQYELIEKEKEGLKQLGKLVEGHPGLIHLALYHVSRNKIPLKEILANAATPTGIYAHHLQRHWVMLSEEPHLSTAFQGVCDANESVVLDTITTYKLTSMGLIKLVGNKPQVSCQLYQEYFQNQWKIHKTNALPLKKLGSTGRNTFH